MTLPSPSAHRIDPLSGDMTGGARSYEKRLGDLREVYLDCPAFDRALVETGNPVVYRVRDVRPARTQGDLIFGTTQMAPGRIGDEFYMTRGHIHAIANRPEVYYGEYGQGVMLLESPEGEPRVLPISARTIVYVPPLWVHRSVNVGSTPLIMSFFYPSDSGQDYAVIGRSGGMAVRIVADGGSWKSVPNPTYRPRSADEIAEIYATCDGISETGK